MNHSIWESGVAKFNMDEDEALAYKCCFWWINFLKKYFPNIRLVGMSRVPKNFDSIDKDPRLSILFKYCFKLVRERKTTLEIQDFPLYIRAQLDVLRHVNIDKSHPEISPTCLVGDKAWKRWKLWKRRYDAISAKPSEISEPIGPGVIKAIEGLERTKEFFSKTFGASPSLEKYRESYINNNIFRWINFGKISPYYIAMSPHIAAILNPEDYKRINFDIDLYKPCITDVVICRFKEIFPHEFDEFQ